MSFPDANPPPLPPPPFLPLPFPGGDVAGFCGQFRMNPEHPDSHSQCDDVPPSKRLWNSGHKPPKSGPLSRMDTMMNPPNLQGGKGTSHIFYKTRLCAKFFRGTCQNGELCRYAHGIEDLQEPPPNWQEHVLEKDWGSGYCNDEERFIARMKLCRSYYNGGMCPYGESCTFLHERSMKFKSDMARQRKSSGISIGTTGPLLGSISDNKQLEKKHVNANSEVFQVEPFFWKTRICIRYEMTGKCRYGEICHFAHSQSEQQVPGGHIVADAPNTEEEEDKKISKWKLSKKITGIYADWVDGFAPPHDLPSNEEA